MVFKKIFSITPPLISIFLMIFLTINFDVEKIFVLAALLTFVAAASASPGIVIMFLGDKKLDLIDFPLVGTFSAMIYLNNYILVLFPSIIFYILPFAAGFTFYLPTSIIYGALLGLRDKDGSSFSLLLTYGIISMILYPDIFWFPYFLGWGGLLETSHFLIGECENKVDYFIMGFSYGAIGASLAVSYMLIGWGFFRPLFMTLPSALVDGFLSGLGAVTGAKIGELIKSTSI